MQMYRSQLNAFGVHLHPVPLLSLTESKENSTGIVYLTSDVPTEAMRQLFLYLNSSLGYL